MGELSQADLIWNRGCDADFEPRMPGDRALWGVIHLDSDINNGGLDHAIDCVGPESFVAAAAGLRFFGIDDLADTVERANAVAARVAKEGEVDILDLTEAELAEIERLEARYFELSKDGRLIRRFESYLAGHPGEFAPLDEQWLAKWAGTEATLEGIARELGLIDSD